jgi:hypothetical protein
MNQLGDQEGEAKVKTDRRLKQRLTLKPSKRQRLQPKQQLPKRESTATRTIYGGDFIA